MCAKLRELLDVVPQFVTVQHGASAKGRLLTAPTAHLEAGRGWKGMAPQDEAWQQWATSCVLNPEELA